MQPQTHEWRFYEVMWRIQSRGRPQPLPWWTQQYFRRWTDVFPEFHAIFTHYT